VEHASVRRGFRRTGNGARHARRAGAQRRIQRARRRARRDPGAMGHSHHRLGKDVGVDAQRPIRHRQRSAFAPASDRRQDRLDREPEHGDGLDRRRRRLENNAFHGPSHPGRPADDPGRHLRGRPDRRSAPGQGLLDDHPAAGASGVDGGGNLSAARRDADLRSGLCPDTEHAADPDFVGARATEPVCVQQVRLRIGGVDALVPHHRRDDGPLHLAGSGELGEGVQ
jgi:hypothetical protein